MKYYLLFLIIALSACSKPHSPAPPVHDTALSITFIDRSTGFAASGTTVQLYTTLAAYQSQTGAIAIKTTDGTGQVTFTGLNSQKYYWNAFLGCKTNLFETNSTSLAIPSGSTSSVTSAVSSTGTLKFVNTSAFPFRVEVNDITVISSQPAGTTYTMAIGAGVHNIRVVQLSGGSADLHYTGTITCGSVLNTTYP